MNITILGLSLSSSWGNGHATTYRSLIKGLYEEGHQVTFLERDVPWYAPHRDLPKPGYCKLFFYRNLEDLKEKYTETVREADVVMIGSYVPEGVKVGEWVMDTSWGMHIFYDIDTPVTLAKLEEKDYEYLHPRLIPKYDIYFSFTGGPILQHLQEKYSSPSAKALYCTADTSNYRPMNLPQPKWDLAYLGTYSQDRQPLIDTMLLGPARKWRKGRFMVAGPQYPGSIRWPKNVDRTNHLPPDLHVKFYNEQRFTLNTTRQAMRQWGYAPSVRLFEAAACGTPIISDYWEGLENVFEPGKEILVSHSTTETLSFLRDMPEAQRQQIAKNARQKLLQHHSHRQRARQFVEMVETAKRGTRVPG